jgi:hypothetical protein
VRPSEIHTRIEEVISEVEGDPYNLLPRVYTEDPDVNWEEVTEDNLESKGISVLGYINEGDDEGDRRRANLIDLEVHYVLSIIESRSRHVETIAGSESIDKTALIVAEELMVILKDNFDPCGMEKLLSFQNLPGTKALQWIPNDNGLLQWDINLKIKTQLT